MNSISVIFSFILFSKFAYYVQHSEFEDTLICCSCSSKENPMYILSCNCCNS